MVYVKLQVEKRLVPRSRPFISYDDELISVSATRYMSSIPKLYIYK